MSICSIDRWIQGDWHTCMFDPITGLVGEGTFGVLVAGALWAALYLGGNGSPTTPTVVMILLATIAFPVIPAAYNGIAWSILLIGGVAALVQVMQKYVLDPATQ